VQTCLAPGRFDRSSANSGKPLAASQFDRNKVARVQKGLVSIARVCRLQPLIALPSPVPSFQCSMLLWSSSSHLPLLLLLLLPKKKRKSLRSALCSPARMSAQRNILEAQPYRRRGPSSPSTAPWSRSISYRHGRLQDRTRTAPPPLRESKA
jgi:hypothetical protein